MSAARPLPAAATASAFAPAFATASSSAAASAFATVGSLVPAPAVARESAPAPAATPRRAVSVHIDHLVLDAAMLGGQTLGARARAVLQASMQDELAALMARDGPGAALLGGGALPHLRAGDLAAGLSAGATASPAQLGRALARALHEGFRR
jgi:hypothetical protein